MEGRDIRADEQGFMVCAVRIFKFAFQEALPRTAGIISLAQLPASPGVQDADAADRGHVEPEISAIIAIEMIDPLVPRLSIDR